MRKIIFAIFILGTMKVYASEMTIIDVRRNITLSNDEIPYKDFYISISSPADLKKNLVVTAVRRISVRDASGAQAFGEIFVPVGQLKIIAVYGKIAVAREYKILSRDDLPMLEQIAIMSGDTIDTQGSFIDNSRSKAKSTASAIPSAPARTAYTNPTDAPPKTPTPETVAVTARASIPNEPGDVPAELKDSPDEAQKLEKTADSGENTAL